MSNISTNDQSLSDQRFRDKHIIITGAGGNFGREGCIFFAVRGAHVSAFDTNADALKETLAIVNLKTNDGGKISSFICDVTNPASVEAAVDDAVKSFGTPDLLWNSKQIFVKCMYGPPSFSYSTCLMFSTILLHRLFIDAGYQGQIKPTLDYSIYDFATVMNVNVTGMFTVLQSVAKRMAASTTTNTTTSTDNNSSVEHKFSIVNTSSVAALRGTPAMVAYSASKAAVIAMTVASAKDLAPHGIRVNCISPALIGPGFMWTRQNELHASSGSPYFSSDPETVASGKINSVPMKRLGSIEEVVKSVAFLLSDDSSYTTAFNMVVDGGLSGGLH